MEQVSGYIDHIIFRNEDNGYTVMVLICSGKELTCVGSLPNISEGEQIDAEGVYTEHSTYGRQFKISTCTVQAPGDALSMERYLGSGAIKGVGMSLAARIVRKFKADTFRIMEEEPERLAEVKGISDRKAREIARQVMEKRDMRSAMLFLQDYGISTALSVKIYKAYGEGLYQVIRENPYRMAEDIQGVGFRIADEIAEKSGIHTDSDFRVRSGLCYLLNQSMTEGHVYLPRQELFLEGAQLLGVSGESMERNLLDLAMDRKIVLKQDNVWLTRNYYLELNTAKMLHDLNVETKTQEPGIQEKLNRIEEKSGTCLEELQREAVVQAVHHGLLVITGGPGTGKTTTINALIGYFESEGLRIALAAPTGRAAKRMTEATGYEARTIHRLLEISGTPEDSDAGNADYRFERNADYPLDTDVLIIDEMSMVDIFLMHALLSAVSVGTRLIMVGDVNQLPSVGPGCVLRDIIDSERIPVVRLTKIFRQAGESDIVVNAHRINSGEHFELNNRSRDFFFLKREDADVIVASILYLVQKKLPPYVQARPFDIQVLTPMRKGLLGVERLNSVLQKYLNPESPGKKERAHGDGLFREGDKVMQIKNNYQKQWEIRGAYGIPVETGTGVFNGDMGIVQEINSYAEQMTVVFDDARYVEYTFQELDELELAYAVTIHKSQGSEYPAVVIPLLPGPRMLMSRNLLYTAVTRARRCVTLIGSAQVFHQMIDNTFEQKRYSSLKDKIISVHDMI